MQIVQAETARAEHPLDVVEQLAAEHDFAFDRDHEDEIAISTAGVLAEYHVAFTWLEDVEAVHVACAFDLRRCRRGGEAEVLNLIALINEQLWVGHFDLWNREHVVMFRHALVLAGGARASGRHVRATLLESATEACDRFYQAFQFVVWAGKGAREAFEAAIFETECEAGAVLAGTRYRRRQKSCRSWIRAFVQLAVVRE